MESDLTFHEALYANLKMMGFSTFLRSAKVRTLQFNRSV